MPIADTQFEPSYIFLSQYLQLWLNGNDCKCFCYFTKRHNTSAVDRTIAVLQN